MRQIIIPQKALDRHEDTLGKALLKCLQFLKDGKTVFLGYQTQVKEPRKVKMTSPCVVRYWRWVYKEFFEHKILTASPCVLLRFAKENYLFVSQISYFCSEKKDIAGVKDIMEQLFDFDSFREGKLLCFRYVDNQGKTIDVKKGGSGEAIKIWWTTQKKDVGESEYWSLAEFVCLLDARYCPYCNAETVGLVQRTNPNAKTPVAYSALDHILPKSKFPLLALSLYNLVPACTRCNSQLKHENDDFDIKHWEVSKPFNALHPYAHNIHKWFRFVYSPSSVAELFLDPRKSRQAPLAIDHRIPLAKKCRPDEKSFYHERTKKYTTQYELPGSYYDLYATEINEILKMEMICTPTFIDTMKGLYKGMDDEDFNLVFRRTSLDPREINKHRFAKLIIDLHKQIGHDVWPDEWEKIFTDQELQEMKQFVKKSRDMHQTAFEAYKNRIENSFRARWKPNPPKVK